MGIGTAPWYVIALAIIGFLTILSGAAFLTYKLAAKKNRKYYALAVLLVLAVCAVGAYYIAQLNEDIRETASSIFVGALGTLGWIFTLIYMWSSNRNDEARSQRARTVNFYDTSTAISKELVDAIKSLTLAVNADQELYRSITKANEKISFGLESIKGALAAALGSDFAEVSRKKNAVDLSIQFIFAHQCDAILDSHKQKIWAQYPQSRKITDAEADALFKALSADNCDTETVELAKSIRYVLNFFETLSLMHSLGLLDDDIIRRYFGIIIPNAYRKFESFITRARDGDVVKNDAFKYFVELRQKWDS